MGERTWTLGSGATVTSNVEGFALLDGEGLAAALVASGVLTPDEAAAALVRRAERRTRAPTGDNDGEG